ncbi:MAG: toll/interleukin-1 receptor domain-containing protein [Bacteroidales bacterium]|nr:toll/interleukin-1 receptor domain-containing protein [Bacteroidales bacterium]
MSEINDNVKSVLDELNDIKINSLEDVYHHYNDNYYDGRRNSERTNEFYKELYEKLNSKLKLNDFELNGSRKTTVFLSHSHEDLEYVYCVALFLKNQYNVEPYIDAFDLSMPSSTNVNTAQRLKDKIRKSDRFIFVVIENSFNSKWCNWELGIADFKSLKGHVAFFVMNDRIEKMGGYDNNEYVGLYPFIWDENVRHITGADDKLYVGFHAYDNNTFISLNDWLHMKRVSFNDCQNEIKRKLTFIAFYFSKFKNEAISTLGYRTITNAVNDISNRLNSPDTRCVWRCRSEFNAILNNNQVVANSRKTSRMVINCYKKWNDKSLSVLTEKVKRIIEN